MVSGAFWIEYEDIRLKTYQFFTGRKIVGDVDAVHYIGHSVV